MGSRVGLRGGLQIHYTGVRIPPHTPNWAISVTRLASGLSKSGLGVRIPYCPSQSTEKMMSRMTSKMIHRLMR
jgi:hypothetical protein